MNRLQNKKAVITAAAQGMGISIARAFAKEGAIVWATDINSKKLSELNNVINIQTEYCDVTNDNSIEKLLLRTGTPDILFNCAGFVAEGTILESSEEEWDFSFELNIKRVVNRRLVLAVADAVAKVHGALALEADDLRVALFS